MNAKLIRAYHYFVLCLNSLEYQITTILLRFQDSGEGFIT